MRSMICDNNVMLIQEMEEGSEMGEILNNQKYSGEIRILQKYLTKLNLNPGPIDGIYGPSVTSAVKKLQGSLGIEITGKVDTETIEEVFEACD